MPNFKKNTSPVMKKSAYKMKGYSYPGVSPMRHDDKEKHTHITDGDGNLVNKNKNAELKQKTTRKKQLTNKKKDLVHHINTGPKNPSTPFTPPPADNSNTKGTLKGITNFEYDFPYTNKVIDLHNKVVKKGINTIKKGTKKVYNYFTEK
tara:strand:+ start:49 stop:495 length:447 start_codon:yes stop_codon:yes gene_type:complete